MERTILHCDMNAFFASVELLTRPDLRDVPMAVCGDPKNRHGIILAKNEPAKAAGVVTAETIWQARRKCPNLVLLPPHHERYAAFSRAINRIYLRFTDLVEPFSIDESWLDVTASIKLFGDGKAIADTIRQTVREELGLTLSAGVSFNKIFAKLGSDYKKPDATTVITRDNFRDILWPLPVARMLFVGKATAVKLNENGIKTIGDLAQAAKPLLTALLGKQGEILWRYANGLDEAPVTRFGTRDPAKSIGHSITFRRDLRNAEDIDTAITALADAVAGRLRRHHVKAGGLKVDIKDPALKVISRQKTLLRPTDLTGELRQAALALLGETWQPGAPIRMLTLTAMQLTEGEEEQLSLFTPTQAKTRQSADVDAAVDSIRARFGQEAITFGGLIGNDLGIAAGRASDGETDGAAPGP